MEAIIEILSAKLQTWEPETAQEVRERIAQIIELADDGSFDFLRSRELEQAVLDLIDEPAAR